MSDSEMPEESITLIQRFGGSLNVNLLFHQIFLDSCYEFDDDIKPSTFWVADPPTVKEMEDVLAKTIHRRRGNTASCYSPVSGNNAVEWNALSSTSTPI
jgi:hypothetical protein